MPIATPLFSRLARSTPCAVALGRHLSDRSEQIREDARFRVLRLLADNPEISQRQLAEQLGISSGAAHYIIAGLVKVGLVKLENFKSSSDKRRYAYILTPAGIAEKSAITGRFLERKIAEYNALRQEIAELEEELGQRDALGSRKGNGAGRAER